MCNLQFGGVIRGMIAVFPSNTCTLRSMKIDRNVKNNGHIIADTPKCYPNIHAVRRQYWYCVWNSPMDYPYTIKDHCNILVQGCVKLMRIYFILIRIEFNTDMDRLISFWPTNWVCNWLETYLLPFPFYPYCIVM